MAHHKSALKRIRQTRTRKLYNRANKKALKLAIRSVSSAKTYEEGMASLSKAYRVLDKVACRGVIPKNTASNRKRKLSAMVKRLNNA